MSNNCIYREEQIWNRVFVPYKNAIRVITDAATSREVALIQVQPGDVLNELEITIPKDVVAYSMKVRGNARMKIATNPGDIANGVYFTLGSYAVWKERNLASISDLKLYIEIEKQRDIELFLWKGNFQE